MTLDDIHQLVQFIITNLRTIDCPLHRLTGINGVSRLYDPTLDNHVLSLNDPTTKPTSSDVRFVNVRKINLLYDLMSLCNYPNVTTVRLASQFQVMLPFATTDDDKLVFPQVTTIMMSIEYRGNTSLTSYQLPSYFPASVRLS